MKRKIVWPALLFLYFNCTSQTDSLSIKADSLNAGFAIPMFNTGGDDSEAQLEEQDVSPLLQSSKDLFTQFASFQFGASRYRMRGYNSRNQQVYINGVTVNSPETGSATWSSWGGLNDVTRYTEARFGNGANRYGFSGAGGYINIDSKASSFKKGTRVSYLSTNRIYHHRIMATHSTGLSSKKTAFTISASGRTGNEVQVPGTYFNAGAVYFSADKYLTDNHLLSFTGFFAPITQGRSSAATKETYKLAATNFYNSNWGYQNGRVRNANVSQSQKPTFILTDKIGNENSHLTSSAYFNFGKSGSTGLNWQDANNPKPDYYRYLPSYFYSKGDSVTGNMFAEDWRENENIRQINWDKMISLNQANLYTDPHLLGQGINTTETRARYILENKIENTKNLGVTSVYNKRYKNIFLTTGINANSFTNRKYKTIEDLLGASFWIDVDQFAENLGVEEYIMQNDIDNPNRKVKVGEKFGYDYSINIRKAEVFFLAEYTGKKIEMYGGASLTDQVIWRNGHVANGKFPLSSKGESAKINFLTPSVKGGITWKISGRHFFTANGLYQERAPESNNIFVSPRVKNDVVNNIQSEKLISWDVNYHLKFPAAKGRLTYYKTSVNDQTWLRTYWNDNYNNTVNLIMTNVNQSYQGVEAAFEKTFYTSHIIQLAYGYGKFIYSNRPQLEAWQDNNNKPLFTRRTSYLKNYHVGGSPQAVAGVGYKYSGKKFWYAGINLNHIGEIYLEPNPDRRTEESIQKYQENETEMIKIIRDQEQLPSYFILNANGGKSFRLKNGYNLNFNFSVNNILNNSNTISSGFESLRWDQTDVNKFPSKYYYMNGISYMLIINFSF